MTQILFTALGVIGGFIGGWVVRDSQQDPHSR